MYFTNMDVGSINMGLLFRIDSVQSENASANSSLVNSSLVHSTFTFSPLGGVIGRSDECDWVLCDPDRRLSGKHAAISFEGKQYFITDISTNGLFINKSSTPLGQSKMHPVKSGDCFLMGPYALVAMIESLDVLGEAVHQASFVEHEHLINTGTDCLDDALEFPQILSSEDADSENTDSNNTVSENTTSENTAPYKSVPFQASVITPVPLAPQTTQRIESAHSPIAESACINFLRGAGLDENLISQADINDLMFSFGQLLKSYTGELMNLMGERSRYKNRCRLDMTLVAPDYNNPLKYCVNEAQALREIVISPQPENLSGGDAVVSAMEDIRNHFWRVEQGYQGTLSSMVDYLCVATTHKNQTIKSEPLKSETASIKSESKAIKPWQYRKQIKQLSRKAALLNDSRFYAEEFFAPRFSYFYQNPEKVKEMSDA